MIIDAHVHVWRPMDGHRVLIRERVAALEADFSFERLAPQLVPAGVGKVVLVSAAQSFAETERLLAVAEQFPQQVAGVVGFLDLDGADFEGSLAEACVHPALIGLRLPLVVFDDPAWIVRKQVGNSLDALAGRGLTAQVLAAPRHLGLCAEVLSEHPGLSVVIDHAGNPGPECSQDTVWREGMAALGRCTNAYCKVGDFSLPAGPLADEDRCDDILAHVVQCFGDNRLVYGSNWPVSGLQQGYGDVLTRLRATARRIGLDPERLEPAMTASALHLCDRSITANWSGI